MSRELYDDYIKTYVIWRSVTGQCHEACLDMLVVFPELKLRGGYVHLPLGQDIHYWLEAPDGSIVDPTESQYGSLRPEQYEDAGTIDGFELLKRFLIRAPEAGPHPE